MANPARKITLSSGDLVRLRDEIAMQALNGLIISGTLGSTGSDGTFEKFKNYQDHAEAAYRFADQMLAARERQ